MIILDDVDMDYAVRTATFGSFFHQGQICLKTRRIIVQRKIADEFTQKIGALVRVSVRRIKITMALGCLAAAVWGAAAARLNAGGQRARRAGLTRAQAQGLEQMQRLRVAMIPVDHEA
jgi:acyl-CoA reductase-like NAD-dependent aldehyde dehydrogenase